MKRRRWLRVVAWIVVPILMVFGGLYGANAYMQGHFNPEPPVANYPKPHDALEAQRQDVAYFRRLLAMDRSFTADARAEANRRIDELEKSDTVLEGEGLRIALFRIVALADNGHTSLYSNDGGRAALVPIRATAFADGIYVLRTKEADADLLGARVVAIDGHPIDDLIASLTDLRGGTDEWRRIFSKLVIMAPGQLYAAGFGDDPDRSTWTLVTAKGETVERTFTAYKPGDDEPYNPTSQFMASGRLPGETSGWKSLVTDDAKLALPLREFGKTFRYAWVDDSCVMLLEMKSVQDENGESIADFLTASENAMLTRRPCSIIIDLRFNGGGDYTNVASYAKRLTERIDSHGHIYILTSPETFSAAITMAGFVKQAAPTRVMILGEPVGDRMAFWSEGGHGCLPNAKLCFHYTTGKHDYSQPCSDWDTCYWVNWIYPMRVPTLAPDETIRMRFRDYIAGRDPVFDRAVHLAAARQ